MTQSPNILLYSTEPAFFERRDTWFNRRGVEVFCAMDARSLRAHLSARRPNLLLSRGVPAGLPARELREILPVNLPVLLLAVPEDEMRLLQTYTGAPDFEVLHAPYEDYVMRAAAEALKVPARRYLRILVQLQLADGSATFGFSSNVSATGILLETKQRLSKGARLRLSFLIPGAPQVTLTDAQVVREASSNKPGVSRYGARFLNISDEDRERIRRFASAPQRDTPPLLPL